MGSVNQRLREFEPEISAPPEKRRRTEGRHFYRESAGNCAHMYQTSRIACETTSRQAVSFAAAPVNRCVRGVRCGRKSSL